MSFNDKRLSLFNYEINEIGFYISDKVLYSEKCLRRYFLWLCLQIIKAS